MEEEKTMKTKMVGIFVCMLLIGTTGIAVADWAPGDGHKMHFPQMPDPIGWDVNFHDFFFADDWQCSKTGPVNDIHFWISWRHDIFAELPFVHVSIYSNNPQGTYSQPLALLWDRIVAPDQFIVAGPWPGDQGWLEPYGDFFPHDHLFYFQINIKNITEPFVQQNGTVYWLVIQMPLLYPIEMGWKTTKDHFMDAAVWGSPGQWTPIVDPIEQTPVDFAFVITGVEEPEEECCLAIESMGGGLLGSPALLKVQAAITNIGTAECTNITWSFRFSGGIVLMGSKSGTIPSLAPGATVNVTSKLVIGFGIPGLLPCNVTVTSNGANNVCGEVSMEKEILLFIILFKVIP
jgi:hypothetical protein